MTDEQIVAALAKIIGRQPETKYNDDGRLISLNLYNCGLREVPAAVLELTALQLLGLSFNNLTALPDEIGQLSALHSLNLRNNQLATLPDALGQLMALHSLDLRNNQLATLPDALGQLTALQSLNLVNNQLATLPDALGQLTALQSLELYRNQLNDISNLLWILPNLQTIDLAGFQLETIPTELFLLPNVQTLYLEDNQLRELPRQLFQLTGLQQLFLNNNQLTELPTSIGHLTHLQRLSLQNNQLMELPTSIGQLTHLQQLHLDNNQLTELPTSIGHLTHLQQLSLDNNQLTELPTSIGHLTQLEWLYLDNNQLRHLPVELSDLPQLKILSLDNNPLTSPPPEIVARGMDDVLAFLREVKETGTTRYEAKLLVVGEGETGKSCLLRALRGEEFQQLSTTHGIEVNCLPLDHPNQPATRMTLNTWDFGGQEIYHATHQFFLTLRSLYLVVWNARMETEQCRLKYWLDIIQSLAPDAPVLLVATHTDERVPDINYQSYKTDYPQLIGHMGVSNKNGIGISELRERIAQEAAALPLMGQPWPQTWLNVEHVLREHPKHHIDQQTYVNICQTFGVDGELVHGTLADFLHDLGKILYFRDDDILCNMVILKPNWITKAISRVLTDEPTREAQGILDHANLPHIWASDETGTPYERHLYPAFLRLMERFYLSYQIETDAPNDIPRHSLVPQLLPFEPPTELGPWPAEPATGTTQVEMIYRLNFVPPGIMPWFIVRTHRYTTNTHWREGVLLRYQGHNARVELNPRQQEIRLLVTGTFPQTFFTILKNTFDEILNWFKGLKIQRDVPCICHWGKGRGRCISYHRYDVLVRYIQAPRDNIVCSETLDDVSVRALLYGIHPTTEQDVISDIKAGQQVIYQGIQELKQGQESLLELSHEQLEEQERLQQRMEWVAHMLIRAWNFELEKLESECPSVFVITPSRSTGILNRLDPKNLVSQEYHLQLFCQHPPHMHPVGEGYPISQPDEWWRTVAPLLQRLLKLLQFGIPLMVPIGGMYNNELAEQIQPHIDFMDKLVLSLPSELEDKDIASRVQHMHERNTDPQHAEGAALRALHSFLLEADPTRTWGGLRRTVTADGTILWLCDEHRSLHVSRQLRLEDLPLPE